MNIEKIYEFFLACSSISTDTRKIQHNTLFVALRGDNFDANTFAEEAIQKGASYVIIDNKNYYKKDSKMILVEDSLSTLQELAQYHRTRLGMPIIALTGSNGKTTTKELINVVLSKKYKTTATIGNLNNHIGVPLTLLSMNEETQIGIVEMGANHQKEIEFLCSIALPDFGYITNFGKAHLEGFGGVEGVIKGKSELYTYLLDNNRTAFINYDDPIQKEKTTAIKRWGFSEIGEAEIKIQTISANPMVKIVCDNIEFNSNLIGLYNANNIIAAITIGRYFKIDHLDIKKAIENYTPSNNRSQLIEKNSNHIILDAYNANPSSMAAAILNFTQLEAVKKIAVLGDMFELGEESLLEHKKIIDLLINEKAITTYFIGKDFFANKIAEKHLKFYNTFEDFSKIIKELSIKNTTLLIKGSRGMALEKTLELL
jgi:UDP-N-acetylmuramoyl-tripeptide--D-alanyl-D-alanine ligase